MEEKVKAMQSKMKRNVQGTKSEGKEAGIQINGEKVQGISINGRYKIGVV